MWMRTHAPVCRERKEHQKQAKQVARAAARSNLDVDARERKRAQEEEQRTRKRAAFIAKEVITQLKVCGISKSMSLPDSLYALQTAPCGASSNVTFKGLAHIAGPNNSRPGSCFCVKRCQYCQLGLLLGQAAYYPQIMSWVLLPGLLSPHRLPSQHHHFRQPSALFACLEAACRPLLACRCASSG